MYGTFSLPMCKLISMFHSRVGERRQSKNPHGSIPSITARHSIKERGTFDMADFCTGPAAACQVSVSNN